MLKHHCQFFSSLHSFLFICSHINIENPDTYNSKWLWTFFIQPLSLSLSLACCSSLVTWPFARSICVPWTRHTITQKTCAIVYIFRLTFSFRLITFGCGGAKQKFTKKWYKKWISCWFVENSWFACANQQIFFYQKIVRSLFSLARSLSFHLHLRLYLFNFLFMLPLVCALLWQQREMSCSLNLLLILNLMSSHFPHATHTHTRTPKCARSNLNQCQVDSLRGFTSHRFLFNGRMEFIWRVKEKRPIARAREKAANHFSRVAITTTGQHTVDGVDFFYSFATTKNKNGFKRNRIEARVHR